MALKGDQRALLQLLCERGQSYDDISGLMGIPRDDVQARARASLTELGGSDPDAEVGLTDYLLGQADPIGRADAVRYLQGDPGALALATRIEEQLTEIAPQATLPKLPEPRGKRRRAATPGPGEEVEAPTSRATGAAPPPTAGTERPARGGMDPRQQRLIAALAAAGVILLFIILAVAGVFGGGDGGSTVATTGSDGSTTTAPPEDTRNITSVELAATGASGVGGEALFGLVNDQQLYVDVDLQGLDPTPPTDSTYFLWLMVGDSAGYPINNPTQSPIAPDQNGAYSGRIAVPGPIATTVGGKATSVRVSLSDVPELAAAAKKAAKENALVLGFVGTELASGEIPLAADSSGGATGGASGEGSTTSTTPAAPGG